MRNNQAISHAQKKFPMTENAKAKETKEQGIEEAKQVLFKARAAFEQTVSGFECGIDARISWILNRFQASGGSICFEN
jgi:hypothetical protein